MAEAGAGEILLTSMDRDGTREGYDIDLTRAVADAVTIPVIASGGVGTLEHFVSGVRDGHATGVLAASIFHFGDYTIHQAKVAMSGSRSARAARLTRNARQRQRARVTQLGKSATRPQLTATCEAAR